LQIPSSDAVRMFILRWIRYKAASVTVRLAQQSTIASFRLLPLVYETNVGHFPLNIPPRICYLGVKLAVLYST